MANNKSNDCGNSTPFSGRVEERMPLLLAVWLFLAVLGPHQELYKVFFHGIVIPAVLVLLMSGRLKQIWKDPLFVVSTSFFAYAGITTFVIGLGPLEDHFRALRWAVEATFCVLALWVWIPKLVRNPGWWAKYLLAITLLAAIGAIIKFCAFQGMSGRLSGLGGLHNPIHTGGVLLVFLAISHFLLIYSGSMNGKSRLVLAFATMAVVVTVLLSESRGPIVAMVIYFAFVGVLGVFSGRGLKYGAWMSLAAVAGVVLVLGIYGSEDYIDQLLARGESYRLDIWHGYLSFPPDSWWLGFGLGTDQSLVPAAEEYWKPNNLPVAHPHSIFIGTFVETGIFGAAFLVGMVAVLLRKMLTAPIHGEAKLRMLGILGLVSVLGLTTGQGVISSIKTLWLTVWLPVALVWFWSVAAKSHYHNAE